MVDQKIISTFSFEDKVIRDNGGAISTNHCHDCGLSEASGLVVPDRKQLLLWCVCVCVCVLCCMCGVYLVCCVSVSWMCIEYCVCTCVNILSSRSGDSGTKTA